MKQSLVTLLSNNIEQLDMEEIGKLLEVPKKVEMGDFAFPCFRLAKELRKAPPMIATELAEKIGKVDFLSKIEVQGGYLNFFIDKQLFAKKMVETVRKDHFGSSDIGNGKTICMDYSSPNVAKNFHVGHLRTTIIGNSLYKIFSKLGYNVVRINHLGDWGTQFGKLVVAYKKWGNKEEVEKYGVSALMKIYVKFHDEAEKDPSLEDQARECFAKMEQGDEEALAIWQWFKDISLKEYMRIYDLLGVSFDSFNGESFYRDMTGEVLDTLTSHHLLVESDGAKIVPLDKYDMPPCLVTKKDGSSIYATRDLAALLYRQKTYHFTKCLYVTGLEQQLHFKQVFKVMELLGLENYEGLHHIPYGLVSLPEGKMSTRKGQVIFAEDILKEAIQRIREIIEEKNPDLQQKEEVAKTVGIGAIIFHDLYNQRIKDVVFSWDKILNFDGETGPYVQYTHARATSVLKKAGVSDIGENIDYSVLTDEASMALLKELARFPQVIVEASEKFEPFLISRYSVAVAQAFNKFYHDCQINVDDERVKLARLTLVALTKKVIKDALELLGIGAPDQM